MIGQDRGRATALRVAIVSEQIRPIELDADLPARELYALELGRALARQGCEVDLFVRRLDAGDAETTPIADRFRLVTVGAGPAAPRPRRTLWMLAPQVRDQVLRFMLAEGIRYDLVHAATWIGGIAAAEIAKRAGLRYTQLIQAPNAAKEHHVDDVSASPPQRVQFEQDLVRAADAVITRAGAERAHVVEGYGADPRRVHVLPWGVDLDLFRPLDRSAARRALGLDQTGSIVLHVGRLLPRTGLHDLLRAQALLEDLPAGPPTLLLIGGDTREPDAAQSPEVGELWRLAAELGVADRVRFVGRRTRAELAAYYAAADVLASVPWHAPFGQQVREAMACARPVVATRVGGNIDALSGVDSGLLVPPEDPRELAGSLRRLLRSPGLRARLGRAGRAKAEREFGWEAAGRQTHVLFRQLATLPAGARAGAAAPVAGGAERSDLPPA